MVDDATRQQDLEPEDPEPDDERLDEDDEDGRPVVLLNPTLDRVSGQRLVLIALMLGGAVVIGFVIYAFITIRSTKGPTEGFEGVLLLLAGVVVVALLLYLGAVVLRALDMGAPGEALGMPEGSIRALIAMSLILIFAIIGIQVFTAGSAGDPVVSTGLTQAQIDALRADGAQVVQQTLQTPVPSAPAAPLYTVTTKTAMSQESHDFGLQLMTTVSTLVVAVAGFYFGSRAVSQASNIVQEQLKLTRQYSRRGANIIGPRPDPNAPTGEAPGENVEDELAESEESEEPEEPVGEPVPADDAAAAPEAEDVAEPGDALADDEEGEVDFEGDLEPEAPTDGEGDEPPSTGAPGSQP
jgi:hypothetical protein